MKSNSPKRMVVGEVSLPQESFSILKPSINKLANVEFLKPSPATPFDQKSKARKSVTFRSENSNNNNTSTKYESAFSEKD